MEELKPGPEAFEVSHFRVKYFSAGVRKDVDIGALGDKCVFAKVDGDGCIGFAGKLQMVHVALVKDLEHVVDVHSGVRAVGNQEGVMGSESKSCIDAWESGNQFQDFVQSGFAQDVGFCGVLEFVETLIRFA